MRRDTKHAENGNAEAGNPTTAKTRKKKRSVSIRQNRLFIFFFH